MVNVCYLYFLSKFTEFIDTVSITAQTNSTILKLYNCVSPSQFCFVLRKKFSQVSVLHVVHHAIMPLSCWIGNRFYPGGHATFFGMLNALVHVFMYLYYGLSALGPAAKPFLFWKTWMTNLQMAQFVAVMVHAFQLLFYEDCGFPREFAYYIGSHAILFFVLFANFYFKAYLQPRSVTKKD